MTTTDIIAAALLVVFLFNGWRRGLLRSLLGPVTFGLFFIFGLLYYDLTRNAVMSVLITVTGTAILTVLLSVIFFIGRMTVSKEFRGYIFWGSRLLGGLVTVLWEGSIAVIILLILMASPIELYGGRKVKADILNSVTFTAIHQHIVSRQAPLRNTLETIMTFRDPTEMEKVSDLSEFKELFQDAKVKELFEDEELLGMVERKEFTKIVTHPKVRALLNDNESMSKFSRLCRKIYRMKFEKKPPPPPEEPAAPPGDESLPDTET